MDVKRNDVRQPRPARLRGRARLWALIGICACAAAGTAAAQSQSCGPDTYVATTADMTPAGVGLEIDVLRWTDQAARRDLIEVLTDTEAQDRQRRLMQLPSMGAIWPDGSPVGYALKYAVRETDTGGGERITLVTDRPIGAYSFEPWSAPGAGEASAPLDYSVVELRPKDNEGGSGTLSLVAEVTIDDAAGTVSLVNGDSARQVLSGVMLEPKPYWQRNCPSG